MNTCNNFVERRHGDRRSSQSPVKKQLSESVHDTKTNVERVLSRKRMLKTIGNATAKKGSSEDGSS